MKTVLLSFVLLTTTTATARPGWFGFGFTHHVQDREQWLVVCAVAPGGPAEKGGLRKGDVITAIQGKPIASENTVALLEKLATIRAGEKVRFAVVRAGAKLTLVVTPAVMTDEQFMMWKAGLENERRAAAREGEPQR